MSKTQQSFTSASSSHFKMPHSDLIDKILALESTLYQANLQNQQLRLKRTQLQHQLQSKKNQLYGEPVSVKPVCSKRLSRNSSQPFVNNHHYHNSESISGTLSQALMSVQPRAGALITGNQHNFQVLKLGQSRSNLQQSKVSTVSSPRTVGIRKNLKKVCKLQNQESLDMGFKTIEQLWNGKKGETFLKKTSEKPTHNKKKSYLT